MLETIRFLQKYSLEELEKQLSIRYIETKDGLVLLKYDHCKSPKFNTLVKECRSLILDKKSLKVVARSFPRFFNLGEDVEGQRRFNWDNFTIQEKVDGSLIQLFHYKGKWRISTSFSFGGGKIPDSKKTWADCMIQLLPNNLDAKIDKDFTYVFEFCSPLTKVVKHYSSDQITLLSIFHNESGQEIPYLEASIYAKRLNAYTPHLYQFKSAPQAIEWLNTQPFDFEGFVFRDINNLRIKVKNSAYVAAHALKNNGNIFLSKNIIKIILRESQPKDELFIYVPEIKEKYEFYEERINTFFSDLDEVYSTYNDLSKKKYAKAISDEPKYKQAILFDAYKYRCEPSQNKCIYADKLCEVLR